MIVKYVTLLIIILTEADNHIPKGDIPDYHPLGNVMIILLRRTFKSLCEEDLLLLKLLHVVIGIILQYTYIR